MLRSNGGKYGLPLEPETGQDLAVPVAPDYAPSLAASRRRRPPQRTTPKNSRLGFFGNPSGRTLGQRYAPHRTAPGYRACGYKTVSGRPEWLSRDPIGENGGLNLYGYVGNNPVNLLDPLGLCDCDKLLSRLQILMRASGGMESDLNGQIGNEMFGETVSTSQMVVSEGLEAGVAVGAAWEIGATAVAENVQPWLGLGGKTMSDYAGVSNQATVNEVKRDALGHGAAKLAQVGAVSAADSLSSSYADSSEYGENTMDLARHATDQMQRSYDALMFQIKQLQLQYRTNCTAQ